MFSPPRHRDHTETPRKTNETKFVIPTSLCVLQIEPNAQSALMPFFIHQQEEAEEPVLVLFDWRGGSPGLQPISRVNQLSEIDSCSNLRVLVDAETVGRNILERLPAIIELVDLLAFVFRQHADFVGPSNKEERMRVIAVPLFFFRGRIFDANSRQFRDFASE